MEQVKIDWLLNNGCVLDHDSIRTKKGEYVGLATLEHDYIIDLIYKHKLTDLQSKTTAKGKELDFNGSCNAVGLGFNAKEQKWYGFTHRGFGAFGIGYKPEDDCWIVTSNYVKKGYECKTLEDCKYCAMCMSDYLD